MKIYMEVKVMNKKYALIIIMVSVFSLMTMGCTTQDNEKNQVSNDSDIVEGDVGVVEVENETLESENQSLKDEIAKLKEENEEMAAQLKSSEADENISILQTSLIVIELIRDKEMEELSNYVHPSKGLRFTPYFYVDDQNHQVFSTQQVADLSQDTNEYIWGEFDGTGEPIDLNFDDYYDRFVYDEDYINPHIIGNNTPIGFGNVTDNVATAYPDGEYVEFHFTGIDPQYNGMDWRSLRLIFEEHAGAWHLVGISHGEWTI